MRIVYCGKGERAQVCLQSLRQTGFNIVTVILPPGEKAHDAWQDLPVCQPENINAPESVNIIRALRPDLIILAGYTQIIRSELLSIPPLGIINLHGGKLPEYRGGSPINWQIINGEREGGCAVHFVDEAIDTGDIICQELYSIGGDDTAETATSKTLEIFPRLLLDAVKQIVRGDVTRIRQDPSSAAYYKKRHPEDGQIFWTQQLALEVHNLIRALNGPNLPGAYCFLDGQKVVLSKSVLISDIIKGLPGEIISQQKQGMAIAAKDKALLITSVRTDQDAPDVAASFYFATGMMLS